MRITKGQLRKIIKEEAARLREGLDGDNDATIYDHNDIDATSHQQLKSSGYTKLGSDWYHPDHWQPVGPDEDADWWGPSNQGFVALSDEAHAWLDE